MPENAAFEAIGSVVASADQETLKEILSYHLIPNNVIFSPSLSNVSVKSLQGAELTFTVLPDGSAWVNNARITFPNNILYNGIAHVIDSVLSPLGGDFDRASSLTPSKPASERVAFAGASPVSQLPFSSISFDGDLMAYTTTPVLLQTMAAVAAASSSSSAPANATASSAPAPTPSFTTGSGYKGLIPCAVSALSVAVGIAAFLV